MRKQHSEYHKDGSIWAKGDRVDGLCDGYWEWFRKDGSKMRSGHFENGKRVGEWITYDKEGKIYKRTLIDGKPKPTS
jgi:antitoxin component YwqK of YwqJK toxin-antitoxin module